MPKTKSKQVVKRQRKPKQLNIIKPGSLYPKVVDYFSCLRDLHVYSNAVHFPGYCWTPRHVAIRRSSANYTVNASGNIFYEFTPTIQALNAQESVISTYGVVVMNNNAYTDVNMTNLNVTAGTVTDLTIPASLALSAVIFNDSTVTGCSIQFTVTGVSNLNRKGIINIIEQADDQGIVLTGTGYTTANAYVNARPLKYTQNATSKLTADLTNTLNTQWLYRWVPNFDSGSFQNYSGDPAIDVITPAIFDNSTDIKKVMVYLSGCDVSTILRVDTTLMYSAIPKPQYLNQQPISWPIDYRNPNVKLQKLSTNLGYIIQPTANLSGSLKFQ